LLVGNRTDLPRVDRVIAKPRGRLRKLLRRRARTRVLRGVPIATAGLDTLHGAQPVPCGWRHCADVLVPTEATATTISVGPGDVV
jgi:hypothetical protein